jgi:vancomycin resistance protein YoaR
VAPVVRVSPAISTESAQRATAAAQLMSGDLRLTSGKFHWLIRASRVRTWISFVSTGDGYRPVLDRKAIPAIFAPMAKKVAKPVLDAEFLKDRSGRIVGAKADHAGRALDQAATADLIATAIESRATGAKPAGVELSLVAVLPKRTTKDVTQTAPLMTMVGSWTTRYQVSAHNGFGANITVPARRLNGTVVQPGHLFDFWGALGEVSFRTGYRLGGAIVGGHSVEGKALAGGICAASTTLFNAALRGGFEIDRRQPHWYYITRYPLGLDATVSGSQTMQFRNDTAYPILIRGIAGPGFVRFEIWSVPNGRTVSLSRPIVTNVVRGSDSVVRTTAIRAGTKLRTEWPVDGKDVSVTRTVRDASGRVVHRETYVSHYHRMIGILQIGI